MVCEQVFVCLYKNIACEDVYSEIYKTLIKRGRIQFTKGPNQGYQENISCKGGHSKGQKCMDLTEAKDIKKRWQEYTEELYKKDLHDQDNHHGVISHLEPDILEWKVKWT